MLTSLELENFKGIAARQRLDFAPLTLIFGANSAGKSTVLQGLLYLHELLARGTADVDRTELGGSVIELGGFARLVHRHDTTRAIVLRVEFATPDGLENFGRDLSDFPFPNLDDEVESAWLELTVRSRNYTLFQGPVLERAIVGVGSEPLVWLETGTSLREGEPLYVRVNLGHPLIAEGARHIADSWGQIAVPDDFLANLLKGEDGIAFPGFGLLPDSVLGDGRSLPVFAVSRSRMSALPPLGAPLRVRDVGDSDSPATDERARAVSDVRTFLEMIVLGTTAQLAAALQDALYIGPLRTVPSPGSLYERAWRNTNWADGLAAWDLLLSDRMNLVERTNGWLRSLGAGCEIDVHELFDSSAAGRDLSGGHVEEVVRRLLLDTGTSWVLPSEVGAGISQVIPVVVAAALDGRAFSMIEQPELHVHPALQVGLGDMFIDAVTRNGGRRSMLIETHSEHLILRVLRRIRETTENDLPDGAPVFSAEKLSVLYVEGTPDGAQIRRLRVDEKGEFIDRWPRGFFGERAEELF